MNDYEQKAEDIRAAVAAKLSELGVTYSWQFVPQSQSRNANEKEHSLNWKVTLTCGRQSLTTDYMQGIGHLPGYSELVDPHTLGANKYIRECVETGRYTAAGKNAPWAVGPRKAVPPPTPTDVVQSLILDADALDYATYEEWASNFGYDPDSRKGEAIYRACIEIALKLRALIGEAGIRALRELTQDY